MVKHSGYQNAKYYSDVEAHKLIHEGSTFKASSLVLSKNVCKTIIDDNSLDAPTINYLISLRTAYLPLRSKTSFFLEPYHPTRFSRQFGFYQELPKELPRDAYDGHVEFEAAALNFRLLLLVDSRIKMTLPGFASRWEDMITTNFQVWWRRVSVSDLRRSVGLLLASVDFKGKKNISDAERNPRPQKRPSRDSERDDKLKSQRVDAEKRAQVYVELFDEPLEPSDMPAHPASEEDHDLTQEVCRDHILPEAHQTANSSSTCESSPTGKKTSTSGRTTSSSSSLQSANIYNVGVSAMRGAFLERLVGTPYNQVEDAVTEASRVFDAIQGLGGDCTALRALADSYVRIVKEFLALPKDVPTDDAPLTYATSEIEENLKFAQTTFEDTVNAIEDQEKHMSSIAKEKAALEASLRTLHDRELSLKEKHRRQLEIYDDVKSKVALLRRKLEDAKASEAQQNQLKKVQAKLDKCKKALKDAM